MFGTGGFAENRSLIRGSAAKPPKSLILSFDELDRGVGSKIEYQISTADS